MYIIPLLLLCAIPVSPSPRLMGSLLKHHLLRSANPWKTLYVDQKLDHFSLGKANAEAKFRQRILINVEHWKPATGSIFFYTGNEGDIELFAENTGFLFDVAPAFGAAVVFAEHRYYGKSMPFGNESLSDWSRSKYLTVDQALADFADNIRWLKTLYLNSASAPVITFGGSYGGMLAGWMRMKYPGLVNGAVAASAPVWMFPGQVADSTGPYRVITNVFKTTNPDCSTKVGRSWDAISQLGKSKAGRLQLEQLFHTCKPLDGEGVGKLTDWLGEMYFDMAMVNYPYPTSFLAPLPAWPVKQFCSRANTTTDTVKAIAAGTQVYSNYTKTIPCLDLDGNAAGGLGMQSWDFQACLEMILPITSDPDVDMFPAQSFDLDKYIADCETQWGAIARPYWLKYSFGGLDGYDYSGYSQIFFSNGLLDPWSAGGTDVTDDPFCLADCPNVVIKEGAHHLDLRASDPADPESVLEARKQEVDAIRRWTSVARKL